MVVSLLNACNTNGVLNKSNLDSSIHWRQSPQDAAQESDQQNCVLNFSNLHHQRPSSPIQNGEENSCYSSENGADNLSPPQETSRSSGSEDLGVNNLFPISGCNMSHECVDYSNSDNESSQASPSSFHEDDTFRSSKNGQNSNSKPKVHKCRNCGFSTTNKHESWEHIATHMKPEKILRCSECPFVTEYKHHLDFHVWNHQGVKPYKCDQCSYVCVNKSMLKSHLKSHSNVYQYSCMNCAYRTKYQHSLKIHLRKYLHKPGLVLDADGKPNPNPVIDVYGNRRGPKQKPKKQEREILPLQADMSSSSLNVFQNFSWVNNVLFTENSRIPCPPSLIPNVVSASPFVTSPEPKTEIASQETDNLNNNVKIADINNLKFMKINSNFNNNVKIPNINNNSRCNNNNNLYSDVDIKKEHSSSDDYVFQTDNSNCLEERISISPPPSSNMYIASCESKSSLSISPPQIEYAVDEAPLNLTVSHSSHVQPETSTPAVKNRRKGVACKLKRTYNEEEDENPQNLIALKKLESHSRNIKEVTDATTEIDVDLQNDSIISLKNNGKGNCFYCEFCEITFFNQIMFTMHMGYHGYSDPFTCNRCGEKTEDKIAFYAHMISSAH